MSTTPRPLVDILIPGHENMPYTRRLLRSLKQTEGVPCQVFYIDNGTAPYDVGQLVSDYPELVVIRLPRQVGFVRAINAGTAQAMMSPSEYVLWLNNDVEVPANDPGWLARMLEPFADPAVAGVGAVSDHVFGHQNRTQAGEDWIDVPILIGFALCLRKEALLSLSSPFLDEHFGLGNYEDWDISLRLHEKGYRLIVNEQVWLKHKMHATFSKLDVDMPALLSANLRYLVDKWGVDKLRELGIELQTTPAPDATIAAVDPAGPGVVSIADTVDASTPPLDDYASMMPVIDTWEKGQAEFLGGLLFDVLRPQKVIDLGCGPGTYLVPFAARGCTTLGVDGQHANGHGHGVIMHADLRQPFQAPERYDLALCIEVAEHLQPEYAETLVANCAASARMVFWSAAHPGQGGTFHYNERPAEYWERLFAARGFVHHPAEAYICAAIAANPECQKVQWLIPNARLFVRRNIDPIAAGTDSGH